MSVDLTEISKLYYSIGEVANMFDVNPSLIRFWEKEFTSIKPKKNKKGNRLFTAKDIEQFKQIYELVKEQGYTLDGAKAQLKSGNDQPHENSAIINRLEKIKKELIDLKTSL